MRRIRRGRTYLCSKNRKRLRQQFPIFKNKVDLKIILDRIIEIDITPFENEEVVNLLQNKTMPYVDAVLITCMEPIS